MPASTATQIGAARFRLVRDEAVRRQIHAVLVGLLAGSLVVDTARAGRLGRCRTKSAPAVARPAEFWSTACDHVVEVGPAACPQSACEPACAMIVVEHGAAAGDACDPCACVTPCGPCAPLAVTEAWHASDASACCGTVAAGGAVDMAHDGDVIGTPIEDVARAPVQQSGETPVAAGSAGDEAAAVAKPAAEAQASRSGGAATSVLVPETPALAPAAEAPLPQPAAEPLPQLQPVERDAPAVKPVDEPKPVDASASTDPKPEPATKELEKKAPAADAAPMAEKPIAEKPAAEKAPVEPDEAPTPAAPIVPPPPPAPPVPPPPPAPPREKNLFDDEEADADAAPPARPAEPAKPAGPAATADAVPEPPAADAPPAPTGASEPADESLPASESDPEIPAEATPEPASKPQAEGDADAEPAGDAEPPLPAAASTEQPPRLVLELEDDPAASSIGGSVVAAATSPAVGVEEMPAPAGDEEASTRVTFDPDQRLEQPATPERQEADLAHAMTVRRPVLPPLRRWVDVTGLHATVGRFVSVRDDAVDIRKPNGTLIRVPIEQLCERDRDYVTEVAGSTVAPDVRDTVGM